MNAVRLGPNPVSCKYCGGVLAKPHGNPFGMCDHCNHAFWMWTNCKRDPDEIDAIEFLARSIRLSANRMNQGLIAGRCECLAKPVGGIRHWYQCAGSAKEIIDGAKMCGGHASQYHRGTVNLMRDHSETPAPNPYDQFFKPLKELAQKDAQFREAMERALA